MPDYGGVAIFGVAVKMNTAINPTADQLNSFFGVSGIESLYGGQRGRVTLVSGLLYGDTKGSLAASKALFESYYDGVARPLTDTLGVTYFQVKLETFTPTGKVMLDGFRGIYFQAYEAKFMHCI